MSITTKLRILTADGAAKLLGISRNRVNRLAAAGKIPHKGRLPAENTKHGMVGQTLFLAEDIERFMLSRKAD